MKKDLNMFEKLEKYCCRALGLHTPNKAIIFDGASCISICKICNKPIMKDSQGNWFCYGSK